MVNDMKVCDLMTEPRKEWDVELIRNVFPVEIQEKIFAITPQGQFGDDTYTWDFFKTGHYTVKSGYWVQRNIINTSQQQQYVNQPSLDGLYQQIWKLNANPKIHHFLWKCVNNTLPAAANMKRPHISEDGSCIRCSMKGESVNHILFKCPYARLVWAVSPIRAPPNGEWSDSLYANLYRVMNQQDQPESSRADLVPWLLWRIWKNRNEFLFKGIDYSAPSTVDKALEDMEEWIGKNKKEHPEVKKATHNKTRARWKAPPTKWIKCSTDGAWHKDQQRSGVGWISRDEYGRMLWAGVRGFQRLGSRIEVVAEGVKWAIHSMRRLGYKQVIYEIDSLFLAKMINGHAEVWPKLQPIIQEINHTLSENPHYKVVFYSRDGNMAAYRIANEVFLYKIMSLSCILLCRIG
ncbi:uncharacterized protein LOC106441652 [Brassica napus]|uniref:uncharacterized protein LOC106441652 n=1 Tax=Brassica napus TaxID=3708 RepID=UPI0006AAD6F6|nr:uncharacterized protein LOC106441652 [Brassica napus]